MQELEKIVEEIAGLKEMYKASAFSLLDKGNLPCEYDKSDIESEKVQALSEAIAIIRNHMNDGWIPVGERLPENAKHKGALCPRYQLMTKYGVTEGWYNPDLESWYILIWFMTERYLDSEIDFERGTWPKIVRCENKVNDRHSIAMAWRPLPEPYKPKQPETCKYTGGSCCWPIDQCSDCPNNLERSENDQ